MHAHKSCCVFQKKRRRGGNCSFFVALSFFFSFFAVTFSDLLALEFKRGIVGVPTSHLASHM